MTERKDQHLYVTRASHGTGWLVRFPARVDKALAGKEEGWTPSVFFADSAHGGHDAALTAAIAHRDQMFGRAGVGLSPVRLVPSSNLPAGHVRLSGVVPGYRKSPSGERYVSRWYAMQGSARKPFSVAKMGMARAFLEAIRARQAATGTVFTLTEVKSALRFVLSELRGPARAGRKKPSV